MPAVIVPATERRARVGREFILAGDARFTIQEPNGAHHTFRVRYKEPSPRPSGGNWPEKWFVSFLSGSNNDDDSSYTYLGELDDFTGQAHTTKASAHLDGCYKIRLLNRVLARVWGDDHQAFESKGYNLVHEGRCGRCGHVLTVPSSIESGFGPECIKLVGGASLSYAEEPVVGKAPNADGTLVYEASDPDCPNYGGLSPEYDPSGEEVVAWRGRVNGQEVVVFND